MWLPSFVWSETVSEAAQPEKLSTVSLGSPAVLNRVAVGVALLTGATYWLRTAPKEEFMTAVAVFLYLPVFFPLLWASFTLFTEKARKVSTTVAEVVASSNRATIIYGVIAIVSGAIHVTNVFTPVAFHAEQLPLDFKDLLEFFWLQPIETSEYVDWLLITEFVSLAFISSMVVGWETACLGGPGLMAFGGFWVLGLFVGHGTALMLFAVWREWQITAKIQQAAAAVGAKGGKKQE